MVVEEAARILKRSLRSVYRMLRKVREKGPEGILHGNRNKASPRRVPEAIRKKVIGLALGRYRDHQRYALLRDSGGSGRGRYR